MLTSPIVNYGCLIPSGVSGQVPTGWFRSDNVLYVRTDMSMFSDVSVNSQAFFQISQLSARGVIRGYTDGRFGPNDNVTRAEMAAFICRAMGWDLEDHGNPFTDGAGVDPNLWRNVGTLAYYGVASGYGNGTFGPNDKVSRAQTISFITRAMVKKGYWVQRADNPSLYPNVPASSGHRADISTYVFYAGDTNTGSMTTTQPTFTGWSDPAPREYFVVRLWAAINPLVANPAP